MPDVISDGTIVGQGRGRAKPKYRVHELLGSGGTATVYRCSRLPSDKEEAKIKERESENKSKTKKKNGKKDKDAAYPERSTGDTDAKRTDSQSTEGGATGSESDPSKETEYAVKVFNLKHMRMHYDFIRERENLTREIEILLNLRHDRIVRLVDHLEDPNNYYLIFSLVSGGELFERIVDKGGFSEKASAYVVIQMLVALRFIHSKHVVHRDLKPENILVASVDKFPDDEDAEDSGDHAYGVKLTDFGLSKLVAKNYSHAKTFVGTPQYLAPEVINALGDSSDSTSYDHSVDMWSLGVVAFVMLSGRYPFDGKSAPFEQQIKNLMFSVEGGRWEYVSDEAKAFLQKLIALKDDRMSLDAAWEHPWIKKWAAKFREIYKEDDMIWKMMDELDQPIIAEKSNSRLGLTVSTPVNSTSDLQRTTSQNSTNFSAVRFFI